MNFRPELAEKVMVGEKTVTRRLVSDNPRSPWWRERCSVKPGRSYAVCPGRGKHAIGRVLVTDVRKEPAIHRLDHDEARREGFATRADFVYAFAGINGTNALNSEVWRVEFRPELPHEREDE